MKKGFTLIELSVVLLVIGILAGIVLRNIGSQGAIARDTRRLGDLRNVANYLATYNAKFGEFPSSTNWTALETALSNAGVVDRLPADPSGRTYNYYPCSDTGSAPPTGLTNHFILQATLEQTQNSAPRLWSSALTALPAGWQCAGFTNFSDVCNPGNRLYCMAQ